MFSRNRFKILAILVLAVAGLLFLFPSNKKKAVESHLAKAAAFIQEKNIEKLMPLFSLYYKDSLGMTYGSLGGNFDYVFKQYTNIRISHTIQSISCGKDTCTASIELWARAELPGVPGFHDLVGKESDPEPLQIFLVRDLFKWKIIGSSWPRRTPGIPDFF